VRGLLDRHENAFLPIIRRPQISTLFPYTTLFRSAPEGEMIIDYAEKQFKGESHIGETPMRVADEIVEHANKAVQAIQDIQKAARSEEHTSELQSREKLVCRLLLEKKKCTVRALRCMAKGHYTSDASPTSVSKCLGRTAAAQGSAWKEQNGESCGC